MKRTRSYTFFDTISLSLDETYFTGCVVIGIGLKGWLESWTSTNEAENDFYVFIRSSQHDTHRKWEQHKRPTKQQDNKKKEVADAKNDAEQVVFMTEKALKDLGEKVTDSDKKEAEDLMEETKKAIETEDVEKINKAKDKLLEKANALATKVYEEAAKNNQSAESAKTETKEEKKEDKDDTVVDAEYEEK